MAYNTKPIVTDKDGNPISQYYNPNTDEYEPVEGSGGGNKVVLYNADGTENNELSLISILDKLSQLTGTVIDEETRKSNELQRIALYNQISQMLADGELKGDKGDIGLGLEYDWNGTQLGVRVEGEDNYIYVDLKGTKGDKGDTGSIDNLNGQHVRDALGYTPAGVEDLENHDEDIFAHGNIKSAIMGLEDSVADVIAQSNHIASDVETHKADMVTDTDGVHGLKIEEGIWNPTIFGQTVAGNNSYGAQAGRYIKIGKNVTCNAYVTLSTKDANMAGNVKFGGLPFRVVSPAHGSSSLGDVRNITVPSEALQMMAYPVNATTRCDVGFLTSSGAYLAFNADNVKSNASFIFSVEYLTD